MPELKPCPACGEAKSIVFIQEEFNNEWRGHCRCGHVGRYCATREAAIAAWNSLPRRPDYNDVDCAGCPERRRWYLTWTTEPPRVEGWYWHKNCLGVTLMNIRAGVMLKEIDDWQWAGPIQAPTEPEAS